MTLKVEAKRRWDSSWTDITSKFAMNNFDGFIGADAKDILTFDIERSDAALVWMPVGTQIKVYLDENGHLPENPDFHGIVIDDITPQIEDSGSGSIEQTLSGPMGIWDRIYTTEEITGITPSSALRLLNQMSADPETDEPPFKIASFIQNDKMSTKIDAGKTLLSQAKSVMNDKIIVDASDEFNIRFPHIYPVFAQNGTTIVANIEPDVKAGYDRVITDDDIVDSEFSDLPKYFTEAFIQVSEYQRVISYRSRVSSYGRLQYYSGASDRRDVVNANRNAILRILRNLDPAKTIEITTYRRDINVNERLRLQSDRLGIDETFIVLSRRFTAEPDVEMKYELGFNLQDLEQYLTI